MKNQEFGKNNDKNEEIVNDRDFGASLVEYGILLALITVVAISAIKLFGTNVQDSYSASSSALIAGGIG